MDSSIYLCSAYSLFQTPRTERKGAQGRIGIKDKYFPWCDGLVSLQGLRKVSPSLLSALLLFPRLYQE